MSKWDWIHAGLEVATYLNAQKAQQTLTEMKTADEIKEVHRTILKAMKSFIFDISRKIQLAEDQITTFPQQVYIVSKSLEWRLENGGLSADMFPDTPDKEYFFKTERKVSEVIRKSKEKLTKEQIDVSEQAVQYVVVEIPMLLQAISAKTAQESLHETNDEWQELSSSAGKKSVLMLPGILGILISCTCMTLSLVGFGELFMRGGGGPMFLGGALIFLGSGYFIYNSRQSDPDYVNLKNERKTWENQLLPEDEWSMVVALFGDLSSKQFQQIYKKRIEFLSPLLGEEVQRYLITKPEETEKIHGEDHEEDDNSEVEDEEVSADMPSTDNSLELVIEKIDRMNLKKPAEEYFKRAMEFIEKDEYNDAILELVKVIRTSSSKQQCYQSAKKTLKEMGFSEADIKQI